MMAIHVEIFMDMSFCWRSNVRVPEKEHKSIQKAKKNGFEMILIQPSEGN
jgi:hypothetical protein